MSANQEYIQGTVYRETGGAREVVSAGAAIDVEAGGEIDIEAGGALKFAGTPFTASAEVVAATNVITAAESGSTFFLNATTEFVSTLPAPALGLRYTFIVGAAPSGAPYTVVTASSANVMVGTIHSSTGGNADSEQSGGDTLTFADGTAVKGDKAVFECDGTSWYVTAFCDADAGITITTAS